jgi:CheY-like chemotaxis protein
VLVADDDRDIRTLIAFDLQEAGFEVVEVVDGADAVAAMETGGPFDALVVDMMMPRLTGLDVCRRVRSHADGADLPIVMVTARAGDEDREAAREAGVTEYVTKPFSPGVLGEVLARLVGPAH